MKQRQSATTVEIIQLKYRDPSWRGKEVIDQAEVHIALPLDPELVLPKRTSLAIILVANVLLQVSICAASVDPSYRQTDFIFHHHSVGQ
jgi:hypothetical protein